MKSVKPCFLFFKKVISDLHVYFRIVKHLLPYFATAYVAITPSNDNNKLTAVHIQEHMYVCAVIKRVSVKCNGEEEMFYSQVQKLEQLFLVIIFSGIFRCRYMQLKSFDVL